MQLSVLPRVGSLAVVLALATGCSAEPIPPGTTAPVLQVRSFVVGVDQLVDPVVILPVTTNDGTGLLESVDPDPPLRDDWQLFEQAVDGGEAADVLIMDVDGDPASVRVLWQSWPQCDERVTIALERDGDLIRLKATVIRGVGPICGSVTYPLSVTLHLEKPVPADRFLPAFERIGGG